MQASLGAALSGVDCEWIRIGDAASMCEGYNRGLARSRGEVLIFCHDDIAVLSGPLWPQLQAHLIALDVVGVGGSRRLVNGAWFDVGQPDIFGQIVGPDLSDNLLLMDFGYVSGANRADRMAAVDGVFLACHRRVAEHLQFDAATFTSFHGYDVDFSFRASLAGYNVGVATDILLHHFSKGDWGDAFRQTLRHFQKKHEASLSTSPPGTATARYTLISDVSQAMPVLLKQRT